MTQIWCFIAGLRWIDIRAHFVESCFRFVISLSPAGTIFESQKVDPIEKRTLNSTKPLQNTRKWSRTVFLIELLAAAFPHGHANGTWNDSQPARIDTWISETRGPRRKGHFFDPIKKSMAALERPQKVQRYDVPSPDLDNSIFGLIFAKAIFASWFR